MKLYVLDLGRIVMEADNPVTKEEGSRTEKPAIPIHAFLIDSPAGKILFDTGCHPDAMNGAWPESMCANPYVCGQDSTLLSRLAAIGAEPEEIGCLVLSHLHLDHAGGAHLFPNAEVYVQADELERTRASFENHEMDVFHLECDVKNWIAAKLKWKPVRTERPEWPGRKEQTRTEQTEQKERTGCIEWAERETRLCDGVTILDLKAGHSYGMLGLLVELVCGSFLLVSDAVYSAAHFGPPAQLSGVVYDEQGYLSTMEFVREYAAERGATVLFGHDMAQFQSLVKSDSGYYE